jgi:murein DD-endopeptidase MepM/ murein hydrolase activator NlpD
MGNAMREHVVISITDISGSRHLELKRSLLPGVLVLLVTLAGLIPLLFGVAGYLHRDRNDLARSVVQLREEKRSFQRELIHLQGELGRVQEALDSIDQFTAGASAGKQTPSDRLLKAAAYLTDREQEFQMLESRIGRIESILGDDRSAAGSLAWRVAAAGLNAELKKTVLEMIPNGPPIPLRGITSGFGSRVHPITGEKEFHKGVDLRAPMKTPVMVPADGVVEYAGPHHSSGMGNLLIVRHNFGFSTSYGHLSKILVKPGEVVKKGQKVALTGNSGLSNGPHLHYSIQYVYRHLDPLPFLSWDIDSWDTVFARVEQPDWESIIGLIQLRNPPAERKNLQLADLGGVS